MAGEESRGEPELFTRPSEESIDKVVAHLPALEAVAPGEIVSSQDWADCAYHPAIEALRRAFYDNGFVQVFDWGKWQPEAENFIQNPPLMQAANLETCVKLIATHMRKERFCSGHFGEMVRCGHIAAILRRLAAMRDSPAKRDE